MNRQRGFTASVFAWTLILTIGTQWSVPAAPVSAAEVVFNLLQASEGGIGEELEDNAAPQSATVDGVKITALDWTDRLNLGELNATQSGFGLNAAGTGDTTDGFDPDEFWTFHFDRPGYIAQIDFANFNSLGEDTAELTIDGQTPLSVTGADASQSVWTPAPGTIIFAADQKITLRAVGSETSTLDWWKIESITVNVDDLPGDFNGDGQVTTADVNPFVLALTDRAAFETARPDIDVLAAGDLDSSGSFDLGDVQLFLALITPASTSTQTPEPSSLCGLAIGNVILLLGPARRRRAPPRPG